MFKTGYLDKEKSIIDIGCWIGDNALIWAKILKQKGSIFAIDPSEDNINFAKMLGKINKINNIKWIIDVCSNKIGEFLSFSGSLNHATFQVNRKIKSSFKSNTLDNIVGKTIIIEYP